MNTDTADDVLATKEQIDTSYIVYDIGDDNNEWRIYDSKRFSK